MALQDEMDLARRWVDQTTAGLKRAGNSKANRSLVVREAILRLQESRKDKEPRDILVDFSEHEARRSGDRS